MLLYSVFFAGSNISYCFPQPGEYDFWKGIDAQVSQEEWYVFDSLPPGVYFSRLDVDLEPDYTIWPTEVSYTIDDKGKLVILDVIPTEDIQQLIVLAEFYGLSTDTLDNAIIAAEAGDLDMTIKYIEDFRVLLNQEIDEVINNLKGK